MLSLRLSQQQVQDIIKQAQVGLPQEVCGLIAGEKNTAQVIVPIPNQSDTPETHFDMDANELLKAYKQFDADGQVILAVYHSHPHHDPLPSATDIREAMQNLPHVIHLIVSLRYKNPRLQAWYLDNGRVNKAELLVGRMPSDVVQPMSRAQLIAILLASFVAVMLLLLISFSLLPPAPPIPTPQ